ncbi:hypothetical protein FOE78_08220 [Microlunatus elymi]|uniref:Glycosyltransferase family 29 (Sialyltransferase) n=1 Tax=Microlunatus elymi TaxID=2596828 RepID=A0A516PXI8_9ACTN|nr:glycosyltransferase family 29 protein [Microlunatus elymi]QDP95887.1 hypothetical protein FOE78_08220 [Microlunatus elymi]
MSTTEFASAALRRGRQELHQGRLDLQRVRRLPARLRSAPRSREQLRSRLTGRGARNREFVLAVINRVPAPDYWQPFTRTIAAGWYANSVTSGLVRHGLRSWRSLPGVTVGQVIEVGYRALAAGDLEWVELIIDGILADSPRHQRAHRLKARLHAVRGEWRPAQDAWRTALGGSRHRNEARRWVINERGRQRARRLIALMPEPERRHRSESAALATVAQLPAEQPADFDARLASVLINRAIAASGSGSGETAGLRPLMQAWASSQQRERIVLAPAEVAQSVRTINRDRFRSYLSGRSVALVANSPSLLGSGLGRQIDDHDLVLRFNSFALQEADTGRRTSIHVAFHKYDFNTDVPVDVRILLSAKENLWRDSLKLRVRPGAQDWLGDASLRWPAVQLGLITKNDPFKLPTAGFQFIRLLMHFGVSTAIDLYGFDFYASGMHRLSPASLIPHSPGHNSAAEKEWVMAHADSVAGPVISMPTDDHLRRTA